MFLALWQVATGMTLEVRGNIVFATGPVEDDFRKFRDALDKPQVDTLVLVNSPGGDLWTGLTIGRLIAGRGMKTVVAGYCHSACSILFMGGRERRFSDAFRPSLNVVGIHGAHNRDTKQINPIVQPQIFAFYKQQMGERFNAAVMNQALYQMDDAGSLLRVPEAARNSKAVVHHCLSGQSLRQHCTEFKTEDAMSLGVLTHSDLVSLDLPEAFRPSAKVTGKELDAPIPDIGEFLAGIVERHCKTPACKTYVMAWEARPDNRSIAVRPQTTGVAYASNYDSPIRALEAAVRTCNHLKGLPVALCEPVAVNGFDLRPMYQQADNASKEALAKLAVPPDKHYANEEFGGGFSSANGYRTQKFVDITPSRIDGARTIGTQELARMLKSPTPPYLIDAIGSSNEVLPGSATLLYGGVAFEDPVKEAEYDARFQALLGLLAPDKSRPVVFYCTGRNCWNAVNAAMRAKKSGYTDVLWYRGGIESWKAAQLPTAPIAIRAVVN